jgi:hypothetical protein
VLYVSNEDTTDTAPFGVIIAPNAAELIDGVSTRKGYVGTRVAILCDGTGWRTVSGFYRFFSGDQTISNALLITVAHGLGIKPRDVHFELKCTTADAGYAVGDIIRLWDMEGGSGNSGFASYYDATNVNVRCGATAGVGIVLNKTTGAVATTTAASWKLRIYATD